VVELSVFICLRQRQNTRANAERNFCSCRDLATACVTWCDGMQRSIGIYRRVETPVSANNCFLYLPLAATNKLTIHTTAQCSFVYRRTMRWRVPFKHCLIYSGTDISLPSSQQQMH